MAAIQSFLPKSAAMTLGQSHSLTTFSVLAANNTVVPAPSPIVANCVMSTAMHQPSAKSVIHIKRPLAPAPERGSVLVTNNISNTASTPSLSLSSSNADLRCKRKIQFMQYGAHGSIQQPASVARRNARERNRVKQVNNGFATLRQHIPASVAAAFSPPPAAVSPPESTGSATSSSGGSARNQSKKLSKVETLRLAVEYIRSLQQMLEDYEREISTTGSSGRAAGRPTTVDPNLANRCFSGSPQSLAAQFSYPILLPTPACSEASVSPTPSHNSDGSSSMTSSFNATHNTMYTSHQDNYENYDPKSPEDEELLDAIFSWQHG